MEVYVLTILDSDNDIHDVFVCHDYDRAIKEVITDLKDRQRFYDDDSQLSEDEFNNIINDMKSGINQYGHWHNDGVSYIVDKKTIL